MNRDVTYKDSLLFHISTMKILCPVFGIIMLLLGFIEAKDGYYVITGLGVIGLLLMIYITLKVNKKKTFSYMMTEDDITEKIIGCAYSVARELGFDFLEKVYENAMIIELSDKKLQVENQKPINVFYHGMNVGQYFAPEKVEIKRVINGY